MNRVVLGLCLVAFAAGASVSYKGEQVFKCSFSDASVINQLEDALDVWGVHPDHTVDARVRTPEEKATLMKLTDACQVVIEDLDKHMKEMEVIQQRDRANAADWFDDYHTYTEIYNWFDDIARRFPNLVRSTAAETYGTTFQGRQLRGWRLFGGSGNPTGRFYFQSLIHAREWIAGATLQWVFNQTVTDYNAGTTWARNFVNSYESIWVPVVNPDGYVYSWPGSGTSDRNWRKNRRNNTGSNCIGVDLNRNTDDHWGQGGSSADPCSETFRGPSAASERETVALTSAWKNAQSSAPFYGAIDFHSYSQLFLRPYGWTNASSPDEARFKTAGDNYVADIRTASGRAYTSQRSFQLYQTTGSFPDWWYGTESLNGNRGFRPYPYTVELRPTGNPPGFQLPAVEIRPTGQENYAAFKNWVSYAINNPIRS